MNGKHYIGKKVQSLEKYEVITIDGIILYGENETQYQRGDQDGYVLSIRCPYATEQMADNLFSALKGKTYKGYRAKNAILDPMAELGDGVTVDDIYSVLAYRRVNFGPEHMAEIAAPAESTLNHEYQYVSPTQREIDKNAETAKKELKDTAKELEQYSDKAAKDAVAAQTDLDILNKLTKDGERKGIFIQDDELYISASAILTGILDAAKIVISGAYGSLLQGKGSTFVDGKEIPTTGIVMYGPLGDKGPFFLVTDGGARMSEKIGGAGVYAGNGYVTVQNGVLRTEDAIAIAKKGETSYFQLAHIASGDPDYIEIGNTDTNLLIRAGGRIRIQANEIVLDGKVTQS